MIIEGFEPGFNSSICAVLSSIYANEGKAKSLASWPEVLY